MPMMTCTFCDAENPSEAVFCAVCGEPFYRAEKWSLPFYHYKESRGRVRVNLRFRNTGVGVLYPRKLVSLDGSFEIVLPDGAGIDRDSWREFDVDRVNLEGTNGVLDNLACRCDLQYRQDTFLIPAPPLRIGPCPDVVLRVGDRYVLDAEGKPQQGSPGDDGIFPLPIRPSSRYAVRGQLEVRNDTMTRIRSVSLSTGEGKTVHRYDGEDRQAMGFSVRLTPRMHRKLDKPDTYSIAVDIDGVDVPITFAFRPRFFREPSLQVLVERPTRAGLAFVGLQDRKLEDLSPKRLAGESYARGLESSRIKALDSDALVQRTFEDLKQEQPTVTWTVPKGAARTKHIAIDRRSAEEGANSLPMDDQFTFRVAVTLNGDTTKHGPFPMRGRSQVPVTIPPLNTSTTGQVRVTYDGRDKAVLNVRLRVEVTDMGTFPVPIAVDFGTTNSCIALALPKPNNRRGGFSPDTQLGSTFLVPVGRLHTDANSSSTSPITKSTILPTRIYKTEDGTLHMDPQSGDVSEFRSFKTALHLSAVRSEDGGDEHPPEELAEAFLKHVLHRTTDFLEERKLPSLPANITGTLPTTFSRPERQVIANVYDQMQASRAAENRQQLEIDESMAAFYFQRLVGLEENFHEHRSTGVFLIVYDFGGGTTDVTAIYAHWQSASGQGGRWCYTELAAGGDPNLGGDDVTEWLRDGLFGSEQEARAAGIDPADIETIKHNLSDLSTNGPIGREAVRRQITRFLLKKKPDTKVNLNEKSVKPKSGDNEPKSGDNEPKSGDNEPRDDGDEPKENLVNEDEACHWADKVKNKILERLGKKGRDILQDVFQKSFKRLRDVNDTNATDEEEDAKLQIFLLLAGNGSRLDGFQETLKSSAKDALHACEEAPQDVPFARVERVEEPKACVAKGAYLCEGNPPDVDDRFRPYVSYWLKLPLDAEPAGTMTSFTDDDERFYVELVSEGSRPSAEDGIDLPADAVGVFGTGMYTLYERRGVHLEEIDRLRLDVPTGGRAMLNVYYDDDGVSVNIRTPASP